VILFKLRRPDAHGVAARTLVSEPQALKSGALVQAGDFGVRPVAFGASAPIRTGSMLSAGGSTGHSIGVEAACRAAGVQAIVGICPVGVLLIHGMVVMMVVMSVTRAGACSISEPTITCQPISCQTVSHQAITCQTVACQTVPTQAVPAQAVACQAVACESIAAIQSLIGAETIVAQSGIGVLLVHGVVAMMVASVTMAVAGCIAEPAVGCQAVGPVQALIAGATMTRIQMVAPARPVTVRGVAMAGGVHGARAAVMPSTAVVAAAVMSSSTVVASPTMAAAPVTAAMATAFGKGRHRQKQHGCHSGEEDGSGHGSPFRFEMSGPCTH
jgi:hypothetical protein